MPASKNLASSLSGFQQAWGGFAVFPIWLMWKQEEVTQRLTREHCAWPEPGCLLCSVCSGGLGKSRETFLRGRRCWGERHPRSHAMEGRGHNSPCSRGVQGSLGLHEQVLKLGGLALLHPGHSHRDLHGSRGHIRDRRGAQQGLGSPEGYAGSPGRGLTLPIPRC